MLTAAAGEDRTGEGKAGGPPLGKQGKEGNSLLSIADPFLEFPSVRAMLSPQFIKIRHLSN